MLTPKQQSYWEISQKKCLGDGKLLHCTAFDSKIEKGWWEDTAVWWQWVQLQLWGLGVLAPLQHLSCPSPQECQPHDECQSPHEDQG